MRERLRDDVMFFRLEKSKQKSQVRPKLTKIDEEIMSLQFGIFCGTCGKSEQTLIKEKGEEARLAKCTRCGIVRYLSSHNFKFQFRQITSFF